MWIDVSPIPLWGQTVRPLETVQPWQRDSWISMQSRSIGENETPTTTAAAAEATATAKGSLSRKASGAFLGAWSPRRLVIEIYSAKQVGHV